MRRLIITLIAALSVFGGVAVSESVQADVPDVEVAADVEKVERFNPAPEIPGSCSANFTRTSHPDKVTGVCGGGSGWFQVEAVCFFFDGGPYSTVNGNWVLVSNGGYSRATCTSARPFVAWMNWDFTR